MHQLDFVIFDPRSSISRGWAASCPTCLRR